MEGWIWPTGLAFATCALEGGIIVRDDWCILRQECLQLEGWVTWKVLADVFMPEKYSRTGHHDYNRGAEMLVI